MICSVGLRRPVTERKSFSFRTYNSIDLDSLRADLSQLPLITAPAFVHQDQVATLDSLVELFQEIRGVVESHAPLKTSVAVLRDPAPWINSNILVFRHKLRRAERIWRGGGYLQGHFESYKCLRSEYRRLLFRVKADYLCSTIADCSGGQKKLYKIVDSWLGRSKERSQEVHLVIVASPTKSCGLDPIPTGILKKVALLLVPAITSIVNLSFQTGVFPQNFKHGLITPLLKKPALDKEVFSNYRPVTNLSFLSKVLE